MLDFDQPDSLVSAATRGLKADVLESPNQGV